MLGAIDIKEIKGEYFMVVEDKPLSGNISPLEDILKTINHVV